MSVDKLVDSTQLDTDLTSVANAIRTKGGTSAQLAFPAGFVSAIDAISTGGGGTFYSGMITLATRPTADVSFVCPNSNRFVIWLKNAPDYSTGVAFFASLCDDASTTLLAYSNRAGSSANSYSRHTSSDTAQETKVGISYTSTGVTLHYSSLNYYRWLQANTYQWVAWKES